jgi:hypothetical protein
MPYGSMWMRRLALAAPWWFEHDSGTGPAKCKVPAVQPSPTAEYHHRLRPSTAHPAGWRSYSLRSGEEAQQCSTVSTPAASGGQCGTAAVPTHQGSALPAGPTPPPRPTGPAQWEGNPCSINSRPMPIRRKPKLEISHMQSAQRNAAASSALQIPSHAHRHPRMRT